MFAFAAEQAALLIIAMQRDFLEPGGFGAMLGDDLARAQTTGPLVRSMADHPGAGRGKAFHPVRPLLAARSGRAAHAARAMAGAARRIRAALVGRHRRAAARLPCR